MEEIAAEKTRNTLAEADRARRFLSGFRARARLCECVCVCVCVCVRARAYMRDVFVCLQSMRAPNKQTRARVCVCVWGGGC